MNRITMILSTVVGLQVLFSQSAQAYNLTPQNNTISGVVAAGPVASHSASASYTVQVPSGQKAVVSLQDTGFNWHHCDSASFRCYVGGIALTLGNSLEISVDTTITVSMSARPSQWCDPYYISGYRTIAGVRFPIYSPQYYDYTDYYAQQKYILSVMYAQQKPDFCISSVSLSAAVIATDETPALAFTVRNDGPLDAGKSTAYIYDGSKLLVALAIPALATGTSYSGEYTLSRLAAGDHALRIVANATNAVEETNKGNNEATASLKVYARVPYTVQFNANGGGTNTSISVIGGNKIGNLPVPERTGYNFVGWWTAANGGSQIGENTLVVEGVTYYARWSAKQSRIDLYRNGGGEGSSTVTATYDSAMPTIVLPRRSGYSFGGYYGGLNGTGIKYYDANGASAHVWDKDGDAILYAYWINSSATITFDFQGGTNGTASVEALYAKDLPKVTLPTRNGWVFQGYFGARDGRGMKYYDANGEGLVRSEAIAAVTLYAYWLPQKMSYVLTLDRQNGIGGSATTNVTYGEHLPEIIPPTRSNYAFEGYYTEPSGDGVNYYDNDGASDIIWKGTSNLTLYASWTKANHITFDANGGTGESTEQYLTDAEWTLAANTFTSNGYVFAGWALSPDGAPKFADGQVVDRAMLGLGDGEDQGITLYAKFGVVLNQNLCPGLKLITGGSRTNA